MQLPEDTPRDFPFYRGDPVRLTTRQWWMLLGLVAFAFFLLVAPIPWPGGEVGAFLPAILFPLVPLAGLSWASRGHAHCLFGRVGWREIKLMILFAVLNIAVSLGVGAAVQAAFGVSPNPAIAATRDLSPAGVVAFFGKIAIQLLGEEVLTALPMLALLHWLVARAGLHRNAALIWAWLLSSVIFGLLHLPTYQWDFAQCLLIIGTARLVLSLAYIKTKNLWVSTGAHILNDWLLIGMSLAAPPLPPS